MNKQTSALAELRRLMPPPDSPSEATGPWTDVEAKLGTPLPIDYKEFVETYGSGSIGEMPVCVNNPFSVQRSLNLLDMAAGITSAYKLLVDGGYTMPYRRYPEAGGLFPWGTTGNGDYLNWATAGPPEQWHIVVWNCGSTEFIAFERTNLCRFLTELVAGRLEVFPSVFFVPTPKFIPYRPRD